MSHISNLTTFPDDVRTEFDTNAAPIVGSWNSSNSSRWNLTQRLNITIMYPWDRVKKRNLLAGRNRGEGGEQNVWVLWNLLKERFATKQKDKRSLTRHTKICQQLCLLKTRPSFYAASKSFTECDQKSLDAYVRKQLDSKWGPRPVSVNAEKERSRTLLALFLQSSGGLLLVPTSTGSPVTGVTGALSHY